MGDLRRLVLLRHATAAPATMGSDDSTRELTDAGVDEARVLGRWLKEHHYLADAVICSPAMRTRQTWAAVQEETGHGVLIDMEPAVYEADVADLLQIVRDLDASEVPVMSAIVVGHAPGLPALAYELCGGQGADRDIEVLSRNFVPASAAVLTWEGDWSDLGFGRATLESVRLGGQSG